MLYFDLRGDLRGDFRGEPDVVVCRGEGTTGVRCDLPCGCFGDAVVTTTVPAVLADV